MPRSARFRKVIRKPKRLPLRAAPIVAPTGQTVTIGRATETNTASAIGHSKVDFLSLATETNTASAIKPVHSLAIGRATETDTASPLGHAKIGYANRATETNTARPIGHSKVGYPQLATETDTARIVGHSKIGYPQRASETDTASSIGHNKTGTIGRGNETDTASPVRPIRTVNVNRATETNTASSVGHSKTGYANRATETDTARALTKSRAISIGRVTETDTASAIGHGRSINVGRATETDTAYPVGHNKVGYANRATETDTARVIGHAKVGYIGRAIETDTASPMTRGGKTIGVTRATETDTARSITPSHSKAFTGATETNTASQIRYARGATLSRGTETNTARAVGHAKTGYANRATETDTASKLKPSVAVHRATETDTATVIGHNKVRAIGRVTETDTAGSIKPTKARNIGRGSEVDTASVIARGVKTVLVGRATETNTAVLIGHSKARAIVRVVETDTARALVKSRAKSLGVAVELDTARHIGGSKVYVLGTVDIDVDVPDLGFLAFNDTPINVTVTALPVTIAFNVESGEAEQEMPRLIRTQPTRVIAQDILTGAFLHWDLDVSNLEYTKALSGPTTINGEFSNEILDYHDLGLEAWGTWIHIEEDGEIRASGILQPMEVDQHETLRLEALGVSAYPHGIPYLGEYSQVQVDPADVVREIWLHMQSYPDADLGVYITGSTTVKIGDQPPEPDEDGNVDSSLKPYQLVWWEAPDCGNEIGNLAKSTPFDFIEHAQWNIDKTEVLHSIEIGFPRIGDRRFDLRFAQDENLIAAVGPAETPDFYASQIIYMGKGEGREVVRGYAGRRVSNRLRRVVVIDDSMIDNISRANALANGELERRQSFQDITDIEIDSHHENAPLGSFIVGDDIPLDVTVPWLGTVRQWERIVGFTYTPGIETVKLQLRRAESFNYGVAWSPG